MWILPGAGSPRPRPRIDLFARDIGTVAFSRGYETHPEQIAKPTLLPHKQANPACLRPPGAEADFSTGNTKPSSKWWRGTEFHKTRPSANKKHNKRKKDALHKTKPLATARAQFFRKVEKKQTFPISGFIPLSGRGERKPLPECWREREKRKAGANHLPRKRRPVFWSASQNRHSRHSESTNPRKRRFLQNAISTFPVRPKAKRGSRLENKQGFRKPPKNKKRGRHQNQRATNSA